MLIPGLKRIVQLSVGNDFCLALDAEGHVISWGNGEQGQLGRRLLERRRILSLLPTRVGISRKRIVSIHTGADHAFAIDSNGNTWTWGSNNFGQTGVTTGVGQEGSIVIPPRTVPSLVGKHMKMMEGGNHHSVGVTHGGECLVWGRVDGAQMGLDIGKLVVDEPDKVMFDYGRPRILLQPTALALSGCVYAAGGSNHNIVITSDGKAHSWGFNANYQCGQRGSDDDVSLATMIRSPTINDKKMSWAGAGGQYSMLASPGKDFD
jgi:regulator of chromosome condensation